MKKTIKAEIPGLENPQKRDSNLKKKNTGLDYGNVTGSVSPDPLLCAISFYC